MSVNRYLKDGFLLIAFALFDIITVGSDIMNPLCQKFCVFDVETPNSENNKMSSMGIVVIENGEITEKFYSLVNPQTYFNDLNIALTGITPEGTEGAPDFSELWKEITPYFENAVLVAHNAVFDLHVLRSCFDYYGTKRMRYAKYICTYQTARKELSFLPNKKLNTISQYLNIELQHHNALSDAEACAKILLHYIKSGVDLTSHTKIYDFG